MLKMKISKGKMLIIKKALLEKESDREFNKKYGQKHSFETIPLYGWKKSNTPAPEHLQKYLIRSKTLLAKSTNLTVDLRTNIWPPVYDQGNLGSCTANALAGAYQVRQIKQGITNFTPSRLFIYYNERVIENSVLYDDGAYIHDGITTMNTLGVCPETNWPYDITQFATRPTTQCYTLALKHKTVPAKAVRLSQTNNIANNIKILKLCLSNGFPFVFGFLVYASFQSASVARTGYVPMPGRRDMLLGGHAVLAVGFMT